MIARKLYRYSLAAMEKQDKRKNSLEKFGYWFAHKIYVKAFTELYDMSPYDPRAKCDHDLWQEQQEYEMRQNEGDWNYEN